MWARFYPRDIRITAHYLGTLVIFVGAFMLVPLVLSVTMQEWETCTHYIAGIGFALTTGSLLRLSKITAEPMQKRHAIAITGLAWIVGALISAVPLWLSGHFVSYLDAVFECVSGFTATGLSLTQDLDHMSMADNMWRFMLHFLGGQGVVVIAVALGIFTQGSTSFFSAEGREEEVLPNVVETTRFIWTFTAVFTAIATIVLFCILFFGTGMEPVRSFFHGLWLTISAHMTGGFAPQSSSIIYYQSWPLEIAIMIIMLVGSVNFLLYLRIYRGHRKDFLKDIEIRTLAIWILILMLVFVAAICAGDFLTDIGSLLRRAVFTIISAASTTGYSVLTSNQMSTMLTSGAFLLAAIAMAVGGSAGSTVGGIKALRIGLIFKGFFMQVKNILLPESAQTNVHYYHLGKRLLNNEILSSAMMIAMLYIVTYLIGALAGLAFGYDAVSATFESIAATTNAGVTSGLLSPDMPTLLKVIYLLQMWLGRLEFLTLLALGVSFFASIVPLRKTKVSRSKNAFNDKDTP